MEDLGEPATGTDGSWCVWRRSKPSGYPHFCGLAWKRLRPQLATLLDKYVRIQEENKAERKRRRAERAFAFRWRDHLLQLKSYYNSFLRREGPNEDPRKPFMPSFKDAKNLPSMHALVTSGVPKVPLLPQQFALIEGTILNEAKDYFPSCVRDLVSLLRLRKHEEATSVNDPPREAPIDLALLENPTTLFICHPEHAPVNDACTVHMSYLSLIDHWKFAHAGWDVCRVAPNSGLRNDVYGLLEALGVDLETATHSDIHALLISGRPVCSCGENLHLDGIAKTMILGKLVRVYRRRLFIGSKWN